MMKRPWIVDSTLRDGEQMPGVAFSDSERREIAIRMARVGIPEIEAGTPAMGSREIESIREIVAMKLGPRISVWCRALDTDLDSAARTGADAVHLSLPVSTVHMEAFQKTPEWVGERLVAGVARARSAFSYISVGLQDASRADREYLIAVTALAKECGADRVRLADTVGCWTPFDVMAAVTMLRNEVPGMAIGFHGHNDLGMATANALAAIRAGADSVDATITGLGERAGNTALEEIVAACLICNGMDCGIDTTGINELCHFVAHCAGRSIPSNKPIIGSAISQHESGIHCRGILRNAYAYQAFSPELFGNTAAQIVVGKHSGKTGLLHAMSQYGVAISSGEVPSLLERIREMSIHVKRSLHMDEIQSLRFTKQGEYS